MVCVFDARPFASLDWVDPPSPGTPGRALQVPAPRRVLRRSGRSISDT